MMESNRLLIPPAELLNRGGWPSRRGRIVFLERRVSFLCYEKIRDHFAMKCPDAVL